MTASNSRHNPVELFAILSFRSDFGARFDSTLQYWVRTQHCSGRILGPKSVRNRNSNRVQSGGDAAFRYAPLRISTRLHSVRVPPSQISGLEFAQSSAVFGPKTALYCSFESNRAPKSLLKDRIANSSTGLWRELEAVRKRELPSMQIWHKLVPEGFKVGSSLGQSCVKMCSCLEQTLASLLPFRFVPSHHVSNFCLLSCVRFAFHFAFCSSRVALAGLLPFLLFARRACRFTFHFAFCSSRFALASLLPFLLFARCSCKFAFLCPYLCPYLRALCLQVRFPFFLCSSLSHASAADRRVKRFFF